MKRSDRTSITSMALSLRATRIARHSWVNSSMTLSIRYFRPELVQRQVGHCPAQTTILLLELLQALHLVGLEPAVLLTPPIIGDLDHADLADRVSDVLALRDQNVDLPQLRDDLFRRVSLLRHCSPPSCQKT